MKRKITLSIILLSTVYNLFSQDFYASRRDFSDPNNYVHSMLELDNNGNMILNTYDYTATFPGFNGVESLTYNSDLDEIYGISEGLVLVYDVSNNTESSFTLPTLSSGDYQSIVIAENRLFVSARDYSDPNNYIHSLVELNTTTGSAINTYNFTNTSLGTESIESLAYNPTTGEIYGIAENLIVKYNINTQTESSFNLPTTSNTDYKSIVIADNRLFVTRRNYADAANYIFSLVELNTTTGNTMNSYDYTSSLLGFDSVESLSFNSETKDIYGLSDTVVLKYNIDTQVESSFDLPSITNGDYGAIVSTKQPSTLSVDEFEISNRHRKVVKVFNLLGQEVSKNTFNEVLVVLFDDGSRKKVYRKQAFN
ncbi:hypothetical protein [Kordia sp.]|uniref:hypothetical protein n=1 Tax=Kordia sp. TaxID=1965332 RepID=UPI003B5CA78A